MRHFHLWVGLSILGWPSAMWGAAAPELALTVATFNLRYASDKPPNSWPERRPVMRACLKQMAPDILGTQEGLFRQLQDIAEDLPAYDWVGLGRDGGSRGEFMAIFFRPARFEVMEFDHFWLSDTPNVIASTNWGNTNRRMVSWVRLRERRAGREILVVNTHLDHALRSAREKSARLIRQRIEQLATNGLPVILLGDFNAEPGREPTYELLLQNGFLTDTWTTAQVRRGDGLNTFHDFQGARPGRYRIDWILTHGAWECREVEVKVVSRKGQFPSDHHPVVARLQLGRRVD